MVFTLSSKVRRGRDRNVGEFTTTYAISPYHHTTAPTTSRALILRNATFSAKEWLGIG
jgi:hypothetical protein